MAEEAAKRLWEASNVWIETYRVTGQQSPTARRLYKFGKTLLCATSNVRGGDNYRYMRLMAEGDAVLHISKARPADDWMIHCVSTVARRCSERRAGEKKYYFVELRDTVDLPASSYNDFLLIYRDELSGEIKAIKARAKSGESRAPSYYPVVVNKGTLAPSRRYVSLATRNLVRLLLEYFDETVPDVDEERAQDIEDVFREAKKKDLGPTLVNRLVDARRGQGQFRSDLDRIWSGKCAVLGLATREVLRASHIKPWRHSNDRERLDPDNGILLSAHLDALFDAGLISFRKDGAILISAKLDAAERDALRLESASLTKPPSPRMEKYLAYHRKRLVDRAWRPPETV